MRKRIPIKYKYKCFKIFFFKGFLANLARINKFVKSKHFANVYSVAAGRASPLCHLTVCVCALFSLSFSIMISTRINLINCHQLPVWIGFNNVDFPARFAWLSASRSLSASLFLSLYASLALSLPISVSFSSPLVH